MDLPEIQLEIVHKKGSRAVSENIVVGNTINDFCHYWPNLMAKSCAMHLLECKAKGQIFSEQNRNALQTALEAAHPFYRKLFRKAAKEQTQNFLNHFFAGACGFCVRFSERCNMDFKDTTIESNDILKFLGDKTYMETFESCIGSKEDDSEQSLLDSKSFGDYVQAFRLIELVFRTVLRIEVGFQNEDNKKDTAIMKTKQAVMISALNLCYLIRNSDALDSVEDYSKKFMQKDRAERPELFVKIAQYTAKLLTTPPKAIQTTNLYDAVLAETEQIAVSMIKNSYNLLLCGQCEDFYIYSSRIGSGELWGKKYCCRTCYERAEAWNATFLKAIESVKDRPLKIRSSQGDAVWGESGLNAKMSKTPIAAIEDAFSGVPEFERYREAVYYVVLGALYGKSIAREDAEGTNYSSLVTLNESLNTKNFSKLTTGTLNDIDTCLKSCKTQKEVKLFSEEHSLTFETLWNAIHYKNKHKSHVESSPLIGWHT